MDEPNGVKGGDSENHNRVVEQFLKRLDEILTKRGMGRGDLAEKLGVGASTVSEWWTKKRIPRGDVILRLPELLGVDPRELFVQPNDSTGDLEAEGFGLSELSGRPIDDQERIEILKILTTAAKVVASGERGRPIGERDAPQQDAEKISSAAARAARAARAVRRGSADTPTPPPGSRPGGIERPPTRRADERD